MKTSPALRLSAAGATPSREALVEESPLAIEIAYGRGGSAVRRLLATTMRTPGADEELCLGFLYAEGAIAGLDAVVSMDRAEETCRGDRLATMVATLNAAPRESPERVNGGLITSACGFCGRASVAANGAAPAAPLGEERPRWLPSVIASLPDRLRRAQPLFAATGACHGAAFARADGALLVAREDVGRHNAVDKVVGSALGAAWWGEAPNALALVLSGRAGYELIQKAAAAGCGLVIAVGAPTTLAVKIAAEAGLTLAGFVRDGRFNVYTGASRLHGTG